MESVEPMLTDIMPSESSYTEQSPTEADIIWLDPELFEKADNLGSAEIPELFQLSTKKDLMELGKSEFGRLVRTFIFQKFFNQKLKLLFRNHILHSRRIVATFPF